MLTVDDKYIRCPWIYNIINYCTIIRWNQGCATSIFWHKEIFIVKRSEERKAVSTEAIRRGLHPLGTKQLLRRCLFSIPWYEKEIYFKPPQKGPVIKTSCLDHTLIFYSALSCTCIGVIRTTFAVSFQLRLISSAPYGSGLASLGVPKLVRDSFFPG